MRCRSGTARKRLAVPFRAAHTPAERSEYSQPDVALLLTHLAYYYDGLSKTELLSALKTLLGMGANAQAAHYKLWLAASVPGVCAGTVHTSTENSSDTEWCMVPQKATSFFGGKQVYMHMHNAVFESGLFLHVASLVPFSTFSAMNLCSYTELS